MTAHPRQLSRQFEAQAQAQFQNLLVSGCSFTYNNSDQHICSWPYYLRDLAGFEQVYDCSQSGAGNNHVFNSTINEIETNPDIRADNTLVIVMWSGLTRTDVIATPDITREWHHMSNYNFNDSFATLSLFNDARGSTPVDQLCRTYKKIVSVDAQVYESLIRMITLRAYLDQKRFRSVALSWKDPEPEYRNRCIAPAIVESALQTLDTGVEYLGSYAKRLGLNQPDEHPTPDGYLNWTRDCLLPELKSKGFVI